MQVMSGKVVQGKIVVEGMDLPEGTDVTVLLRQNDQAVELSPEQEAELLEAIDEADRGEMVDGWELLERLKRKP